MQKDDAEALVKDELEKREKGSHADRGVLIRCDHAWQKKELEAEAAEDGRSLSSYLLRELGKRRHWRNRNPDTGEVLSEH